MADNQKVVTGLVRLSYPHLFEPRAGQNPDEPKKYSTTVLLPKTDTATKAAIDAAIEVAKQQGAAKKWGGSVPKLCPSPVHDGDGARPSDGEDFPAECKGNWVFTASNRDKPGVVDRAGDPITNASEIYGGIWAFVSVRFFPYAFNGKKGVGCILQNVMKRKDDAPLKIDNDPRDDFKHIANDDDEEEDVLPF